MKRTAIIVPEFNECSRGNLEGRLNYFDHLASSYQDLIDVIIVDDASTDGSKKFIQEYVAQNKPQFKVHFMEKNGQKVGALKEGVENCSADIDTILLTDFDSTIPDESMKDFQEMVDMLHSEDRAGMALRVDTSNGDQSYLAFLQGLEYIIGRGFHYVAKKEGKTRCIAGAGGIWKRNVLERLFPEHSGRHNGDDMELTALAMKHGHRLDYHPFSIKTIAPTKFRELIKQRIRWELGALETIDKERKFYLKTCLSAVTKPLTKGKLDHFGFWKAWQIGTYIIIPYGITQIAKYGCELEWKYFASYLACDLGFLVALSALNRKEISKDPKTIASYLVLPFYNLGVQYPSRTIALAKHFNNRVGDLARKVAEKIPNMYQVAEHVTTAAVVASQMF